MVEGVKVDVNINEVFEPVEKGIRNAIAYSAIVLNPKNKIEVSSIYIDEQYRMVNIEEDKEIFINSFTEFVVYNALCCMMTSFETTLERAYKAFIPVVMYNRNKIYLKQEYKKDIKKFDKFSFEKKIKEIKKFIKKSEENEQLWLNLKHVRNCITHNGRVVKGRDVKLKIPAITMECVDLVTKEVFYSNPEDFSITMGKIQNNPRNLTINFIDEEKIFKHGENIKFTKKEISFIIYAMDKSIKLLYKEFMYLLLDNGMPINCTNGLVIKTREELDKVCNENGRPTQIILIPQKEWDSLNIENIIKDDSL